jgi:hypothetical protein
LLQSAGHGCRFATVIPGVPVNAVDLLSVFPAVSQDMPVGKSRRSEGLTSYSKLTATTGR